jgi:CDK inhibitor PHO81
MSIKECVRVAQSNNFMGLVCPSRLMNLVPALVTSIKEAGLVLLSDYSCDPTAGHTASIVDLPPDIDGLLMENAVLRFRSTVDQ